MWNSTWREESWVRLSDPWDILIIGGGITGAGIFQQAARLGLEAVLVEQRDFAWGTSSRSSKMVHGGLRYLKDGNVQLTYESVREREKLLAAGPGLVDSLGFLIANYKGDRPGAFAYNAALTIYDLLALNWSHKHYTADEFRLLAPHLAHAGLQGGFRYGDAQTDDSRLTMRVLSEGMRMGGLAFNYVRAESLLRENERVVGAQVRDEFGGRTAEIHARLVINATGAWVDFLRGQVGAPPRIRPLRGSHLVFPAWRFPVAQAITFLHPVDHRPVFAFPWEGVTLIGTTDVDHDAPLNDEPAISGEEVAYLMAAADDQFPGLHLTLDDVIGTWAGVRPVIDTGKTDPSKESRDHAIWEENGLLTVTGGKLTTFRLMAVDVLKAAREILPELPEPDVNVPPLQPITQSLRSDSSLDAAIIRRLEGRYGDDAPALVAMAQPGELTAIPGTPTLWVELRWAARNEAIIHLEDLLLRRSRLGLLLRGGGADPETLARIRSICQPELGWDDSRWNSEVAAYRSLWDNHYGLPPRKSIPDWQIILAEVRAKRATKHGTAGRRKFVRRAAMLSSVGAVLYLLTRNRRKRE